MSTQAPNGIEHIEAYNATQADRDAVKVEDLGVIYVDIPFASSRAAAAATRAARYSAEIARLPVPADLLARITRYALAAAQAHIMHLAAEAPSPEIAAMSEPLYETRETMIAAAKALVAHKLIPADVLGKLSGTRGHRDLGFDVMFLCTIFRGAWPNIQGRTAVRFEDLDPVHKQAEKLVAAVGLRDDREKLKSHAHQQKTRALHLLNREYDQLRRVLTFILWGTLDVSDIAPAFTATVAKAKAKGADGEDEGDAAQSATGTATPKGEAATGNGDVGGPFSME